MGMLKSISLTNYKCFNKIRVDNGDELELSPLTILCGVNSSGKSSILKSLLMLKQSFEDNSVSNYMLFNGKYIDNGSFDEILYDKSKDRDFTISNTFEISKTYDRITKDITNLRDLRRLYYNNSIQKFVIKYSVSVINGDNLVYSNRLKKIAININIYKDNLIDLTSEIILENTTKNKYTIHFKNIPDVSGKIGSHIIEDCSCYFGGMSLNSIYKDNMNDIIKLFIPTITSIFNIVSIQYLQVRYIAPLRENPKRRYIADKNVNDVGIAGELAPLLLNKISRKKWRGICAPNSEDDFRLSNYMPDKNDFSFINILNSWMHYLELGGISIDGSNNQKDIIKVRINNHNITDVGFGVSQSLPILTEGIFLSPSQTLLLEQPEIHLHPKMQMRMADFLLSLSVQNKSIIVETHSDHIINRIVRRYMEDEGVRDKIKIYFLDESTITKVSIDEVDGAACTNSNFFYQFALETEKILDAGYKNLEVKEG